MNISWLLKEFLIESLKFPDSFIVTKVTTSWSIEDKKKILLLLQQYGVSNLETIQKKMPHKTIAEIRYICEKHNKLALSKWCTEEDKKYCDNVAIKDWLQILKHLNSVNRGSVQDIIPRVLKYIALYERQTDTPHVCLRDCYLVLSDISNGLASKYLDNSSNIFFFECLTKLAEALKNGDVGWYKKHLKNLKDINELLKVQAAKETKDTALLNPLNVSNDLLKMSEVDKLVDILE